MSSPIRVRIVPCLILIAGLLAGCGGRKASDASESAPPEAPLAVQVSEPEPTATPLPTAIPQPTATPPPTETTAPPTDTPVPTTPPEPTAVPTTAAQAEVNVETLNFRAGPGTNYPIIGQFQAGDQVTVTGKNEAGDWFEVSSAEGTTGWLYGQYVTLSVDPDTIAVAAEIPDPPQPARPAAAAASNPPPALPPPLPANAVPDVNPLTGLPTDRNALARRPVLVRMGNDPVARSVQAGLSQADVVYEEIMDGWGVTRYTAVFWSQDPPMVRPVRSARLLSIDLAKQYQGALAHSGASDPIRWRISQSPIIDLDEFFNPQPYTYGPGDWRTRLYTTLPRIRAYLQAKGWDQPVDLKGWNFSEQPPSGAPANTVTIPYPNGTVVWRWDETIGRYRRFIDGNPDIDANNGQQITAANVILIYANHAKTDIVEDSLGSTAIDIQLTGSGNVKIVRDGLVIDGTWQRNDEFQPTTFSVPLKPGNSWIELIPSNVPEYFPTIQ